MESPIGFVPLRDAADIVGRELRGDKWRPIAEASGDTIICKLDPEIDLVIRTIAELCETGDISTAYRSINGVDSLDREVWQRPHWRSYFARGTIDLDLPLLDSDLRPNPNGYTARCTREVFVRKDDLNSFMQSLPPPPLINTRLRYPSDAPLIQEALKAIKEGRAQVPNQASKLVYLRAEGPSPEANRDRLRKLIAEELKARSAPPKIAKTSPNT